MFGEYCNPGQYNAYNNVTAEEPIMITALAASIATIMRGSSGSRNHLSVRSLFVQDLHTRAVVHTRTVVHTRAVVQMGKTAA